MDENQIEQVEAQVEETSAPVEDAVVDATEVAEGCQDECQTCKAKHEPEDDEEEKKVKVEEALDAQAEHILRHRKEVAKEEAKDKVNESLFECASEKVTDLVMEAIENLSIVEGLSEDDVKAQEAEIIECGQQLLADVTAILEEIVNGTTVELNGAQVEVKDFVGTGGKVSMSLPAGINPPEKSEDDESERKVTIKAYHEGAEEVNYKAKYAESEAIIDDLINTVENTATKYQKLAEEYNTILKQLQAYEISEEYGITVDDAADMLKDFSCQEICEELEKYESGQLSLNESAEEKAEDAEVQDDAEKDEDKEKEEKAEEILKQRKEEKEKAEDKEDNKAEDSDVEGAVVDESLSVKKIKAFSVFASNPINESKKARKAYSVFAD